MKYRSRRQYYNVWIICIFGCVTSDVIAACNQHDKHVHLREIGNVSVDPNSEIHHDEQSVIDNSIKDVHDTAVTADTQVNYDGNDDVTQIAHTDVIKQCNCKDGCSKEHTCNDNINTKDVTTDDQLNYNRNIEDVTSNLNAVQISTIYLAGYDDQIYKLLNDVQKHSTEGELLVYFYLYTNNSYRNIGYLYTDKNTLRDCIEKYTHYFCVGHNNKDCMCLKSLSNAKPTEKTTFQTGQEPYIRPELNKIYYTGSIPGEIKTEPEIVKLGDIGSTISNPKVYYPEKESLEAHEFILPKEKDIKFKDIYIDVLKSQKLKALAENQIVQDIDSVNNAKPKVEIDNNITSNKDKIMSLEPLLNQPGKYDFKGIPNEVIETDSISQNPDDTNILIESLHKGESFLNNNRNYAYGIMDEGGNQENTLVHNVSQVNLPSTETLLQFKPNIYTEPEDIISSNKLMEIDGSTPEVQIIPNIFKYDNTILEKPANNIVNEIVSETSSPKIVGDKYLTYSQNNPEYNALNTNIADNAVSNLGNDNERTVSLTPVPIPEVIEMNSNLEYSNDINNAITTKLNNENIIINPAPSNEVQVMEMTPKINNLEIAANNVAVNTNETNGRYDKNNMAIDDKLHIQNTEKEEDVAWFTPYTPTLKLQDRFNNIVKFVNKNYQSIPNGVTNIKVVPQSYTYDYNNGYRINTQPCNNYQLIVDQQYPYFYPWNSMQYGDFQRQNQPILQSLDQTNKVDLLEQNPFNNLLQSTPRDIHTHHDFDGNVKHDTSLGNLSYTHNTNLHTLNPSMSALNVFKPLLSNYKDTDSYLSTEANMKPEAYITKNIPQKLNIPLNNLRINGLPTINQPSFTNYKPLIASDPFRTSVTSLPLKSDSIIYQTGFSQPIRMSNSQETNEYSTVGPKAQPFAQDATVTGFPNSAYFTPTRLNTAFLPTLNSYYYKTSLPKSTFSTLTDCAYHPSMTTYSYNPFSFTSVAPIKDKTEALHSDSSPNLLLPQFIADSSKNIVIPYQSLSKLTEDKLYASDENYIPKSKLTPYFSLKEKSDSLEQSDSTDSLNLSNLEPNASNSFKIQNNLVPSSVLPLSTLTQEKRTHSPLLSGTASYKPLSAVLMPSEQTKTVPLIEMDKYTYESTPLYSDRITPTKPLNPSSNNVVVPNNMILFTPVNQPLRIPYNNGMFQNIVPCINDFPPNTISSTPDLSLLTPPSKTQDTESSTDTKNSPYKPKSSISFVSNFDVTKPYQANLIPISFNGDKYSTFTNTQEPTSQNLLISNSNALPARLFKKYLASIEKFKNVSPDICGSTSTDTYPTKYSKPLVSSPNYLIAPKYTDGNINPWLLSSYQKSLQPKICPSIAKPFEILMSGNADSMLLKDSKSAIPYSYQPIATQTLMPTSIDSVLPNQEGFTDSNSVSVEPCRFVENFATPILSDRISPYSYSPAKQQNIVTWLPPCIQNDNPYLQINNMNDFVSVHHIPTGKSVSKDIPLKYGEDYGLTSSGTSNEEPKYGLASQVPYIETRPLVQTVNIDSLNSTPKLALQSTIPLMSNLGQGPKIWSVSNPDYTKSSEPINARGSIFLGHKTPKFALNNLNPSTYSQIEETFIPSSSNEMRYPFSRTNLVSPVPDFTPCSKFSSLQENKPFPKKVTEIPLIQGILPNSANRLPINLDTALKPADIASIHDNICPRRPLLSNFHSLINSPSNLSANNLNTLWSSLIPYNKDFDRKNEESLSNFITPNLQNLTPMSSYHNAFTIPALGTAVSSAVNTPKEISPTALSIESSFPQPASYPILNKQHILPCNNYNMIPQKPLDFSSFVDQIKPISKIDDNKVDITFANLQPHHLETSNLTPIVRDTITWSNLSPSSYPYGIKSSSILSPFDIYQTPSISTNIPRSTLSTSEKPTLITSSPTYYLPYSSLLWKTLANQKPDLTSHFTDSTQRFYASSIPQSTRPNFESQTPIHSQLNSNNNKDLLISTYSPYRTFSTIKETDTNSYPNPILNNLGYYKYGNIYQNNQIKTPASQENLKSQIVHTNKPYLEIFSNIENMQQSNNNAINQINNGLNNYVKQRDVLSNVLNGNLVNVPLHNMGIVDYEPKLGKISYIKTNNPDIDLKIWPATVNIVKPKIVFETDKFNALNFCPVVNVENSHYTNEEIQNVVENFVKTFYGEPIIVKTVDNQKSYAIVDNIDQSYINNGKVYIVWALVCDCGCNRIGCHCNS